MTPDLARTLRKKSTKKKPNDPTKWSKSYTPPKYADEPDFRKKRGMRGPEQAAWKNNVSIEHAREVLGLAFDEFDALTDVPYDESRDEDEATVALVAKHGAAPDPWGREK